MQAVVDAHAVWNKPRRRPTSSIAGSTTPSSSHPPPAVSGRRLKLNYITQAKSAAAELRAVLHARRRGAGSLSALPGQQSARGVRPARHADPPDACARRTIRSPGARRRSDERRLVAPQPVPRRRAAPRSSSSSSPCCSTCWRSASSSRCCRGWCVGFMGGDTARRGRSARPVRHRLGADAVPVLAAARRAVGPLRPPAGDPDLELRPRPRLHPDGARAVAVRGCSSAASSPASRRRASRPAYAYIADVTPPEQRAARFGMLGVAFGAGFVLGPALGGLAGSDRSAPAVLDRGRARASPTRSTAGSSCRSRCRATSRMAFAWRRANPLGALKLLRSHRELFGLATRQLPRHARACGAAEHQRALHDVSLRLGRAHGRLHAWRASASARWSCRAG